MDENQLGNQTPNPQPNWQQPPISPQYPPQQPGTNPAGQPPVYSYPPPYQQGTPQYAPIGGDAAGLPGSPPQQYGIPPQPPKKKLKWWHWALIGSAGLLLLCCVGGTIVSSINSQSQNNQTGVGMPATQATKNSTPAPTATAIPSPTPVAAGQGQYMALGADFKQDGQGFSIIQPKGAFSSGESLAYVISLDGPIGTTQVQLILASEGTGGTESSVFSQDVTISNPEFNELANRIPNIGTIMSDYSQGSGKYKLELSDGHKILAQAEFTFTL